MSDCFCVCRSNDNCENYRNQSGNFYAAVGFNNTFYYSFDVPVFLFVSVPLKIIYNEWNLLLNIPFYLQNLILKVIFYYIFFNVFIIMFFFLVPAFLFKKSEMSQFPNSVIHYMVKGHCRIKNTLSPSLIPLMIFRVPNWMYNFVIHLWCDFLIEISIIHVMKYISGGHNPVSVQMNEHVSVFLRHFYDIFVFIVSHFF
jgi:hypothetical protein